MKIRLVLAAAGFLFGAQAVAQQVDLPRVFLVPPETLAAEKAHPSPELLHVAKAEAEKAMRVPPQTVTSKQMTPPSGDKRDYMSMGRYWWPNPNTPDHLPYIRKDGQSNPQIKGITDHEALSKTEKSVHALALGYYLTGDEHYAKHAAEMLRTFFLDDKTGMDPNLEYAQAVPGVNTGRGAGVLDARGLAYVVDALGMLHGAKAWTAEDEAAMKTWFDKYYAWLTTSDNGRHEAAAKNNHGSWYAVQQASIAQYLGRPDEVRTIAERVLTHRIPDQFDSNGLQKYELERTNSFSYSAFNLEALTQLAAIVSSTGIDLYQPVTLPGGAKTGILKGIDALLPYDAQHPWPHPQISKGKLNSLCPALFAAANHRHDAKYADAEKRFSCAASGESSLQDPEEGR